MDEQIAELRERIEDHLRRYGAESSRLDRPVRQDPRDAPDRLPGPGGDRQRAAAGHAGHARHSRSGPRDHLGRRHRDDRPAGGRGPRHAPARTSTTAGRPGCTGRGRRWPWRTSSSDRSATRTDPLMARYGVAELRTIEGFMADMADAMAGYRADLETGQPPDRTLIPAGPDTPIHVRATSGWFARGRHSANRPQIARTWWWRRESGWGRADRHYRRRREPGGVTRSQR